MQSRSDWAVVRRSRWRIHCATIERFISVYRLEENGSLLKEGTGDAFGWALRACSYKTNTEAAQPPYSSRGFLGFCLSFFTPESFHSRNSCSKQNESCLNESIYQDSWREKRKEPAEETNNFERFFGDSTLTFLTYRNTFRLPILPTRRIIFLCLPQIKIRRREILIC